LAQIHANNARAVRALNGAGARAVRPIDLQERRPPDISPLELGLVELPTRPRSEYTAEIRREAIDAAEGGRMGPAADLTRAAMTEDPYARGVLGSLVDGLWGLPMNFIGDPTMIAALTDTPEGAGEWRTMFPQPEARKLMAWGVNLGIGVGQMRRRWHEPGEKVVSVEEAEDGSYKIDRPERPIGAHDTKVLRTWDPGRLRCQWWDGPTWWLMTADGEIRITPNDGEWLLYLPYGEIKPWEYAAWKALTLAFILGRDGLFDRSRHAVMLAPVRVGTVPQGTTQRQREKYLRQIKEMQRMHAFVLPPGLDYKIVESTARINDIYSQVIAWAERSYRLIYTGNETSTTGSAGFSAGDVQERIAKSVLSSFSSSLATCLRDGGLVEWAVRNYGVTKPEAPLAKFDCEPPEDKLSKAKTITEAGGSLTAMTDGLQKIGLRITMESATAYAQSFGFAVEPIPAGEAKAAKIDLAPTDKAKAFLVDEVRAGEGYAPIGDDRGKKTLAEMDAAGAAPPGGEAQPDAPAPVADAADAEPPTDESAAALAAAMTQHGVATCEHERPNRCPLCGVERERVLIPGLKGAPHTWGIKWRPILRGAGAPRPLPAPLVTAAPMPRTDALTVALDALEDALEVLDALGEEPGDEEDDTLDAAYNPSQPRASDGKFGSGGGGATHNEHGHPIVKSEGSKDGLGRSKAARQARKDSGSAKAASEASRGGGSHEDAAKAHAGAAEQHKEAAARSARPDYRAAHEAAAKAHEDVAKAHAAEHAKSQGVKPPAHEHPSPEVRAAERVYKDAHAEHKAITAQVAGGEEYQRTSSALNAAHAEDREKSKAAAEKVTKAKASGDAAAVKVARAEQRKSEKETTAKVEAARAAHDVVSKPINDSARAANDKHDAWRAAERGYHNEHIGAHKAAYEAGHKRQVEANHAAAAAGRKAVESQSAADYRAAGDAFRSQAKAIRETPTYHPHFSTGFETGEYLREVREREQAAKHADGLAESYGKRAEEIGATERRKARKGGGQ
jgi:hypothetical protein